MNTMNALRTVALALNCFISACSTPNIGFSEAPYTTGRQHWLEQSAIQAEKGLDYYNANQAYLGFHTHEGASHSSITPVTHRLNEFHELRLSEGDRIRVWIPSGNWPNSFFGNSDTVYEGIYEIGQNNQLRLPFLAPISTSGLSVPELETLINQQLTDKGIFKAGMAQVSITIQDLAPINVFVSGAVFNAGQKTINTRNPLQSGDQFNVKGQALALERRLSSALRASGGVRPDADISRVEVIRGHQTISVDLTGLIKGFPSQDINLQQGDQVRVPSQGLPQTSLITLSPITPPGIRLYISNLTQPAMHNAGSAIGKHATSLPYGARLHNAVASGNCAGGAASTNSDRHVVLITTDPVRQQPVAIERNIETLLRQPHKLSQNPYLMPDDSIVCYDSEVTNIREIARTITDILLPIPLVR